MKVEIKQEKLFIELDVDYILENISDDDRRELAETAAFQDSYREAIVELICAGSTPIKNLWSSRGTITYIRRELIKRLDELKHDVARELMQALKCANTEKRRFENSYWKLFHYVDRYCPDVPKQIPDLPKYEWKHVTDEEVAEAEASLMNPAPTSELLDAASEAKAAIDAIVRDGGLHKEELAMLTAEAERLGKAISNAPYYKED